MQRSTITSRHPKQDGYTDVANLSNSLPLHSEIMQEKSSQFAYALTHEIRNPLANINLAMEVLKRLIRDDDKKPYLDIILRASQRINHILNDLLSSSQLMEIQIGEHSIHQLLDEVLVMTGDRRMFKNIRISKKYAARNDKAILDRAKMKIALTNIIINAIEAMPPENGELNLVTKTMKSNCFLNIEDNGNGISKEELKTIFKPYISNKPGGMGLGLSTTLNILTSNHVGIKVRSEKGRGTTFSLLFKINQQTPVGKKELPFMV